MEFLNQWSPILVLATYRGKRRDACLRSGLPQRTFRRIGSKTSWATVRVDQMVAFCQGCQFDMLHRSRRNDYLRTTLSRERPLWHLNSRQIDRINRLMLAQRHLEFIADNGTIPALKP